MVQVLVGALLAGGFALLGAWYQHGREHERWLRASRLDAYSEFLAAIDGHLLRESYRAVIFGEQAGDPGATQKSDAPADPGSVEALRVEAWKKWLPATHTTFLDSVDAILQAEKRIFLVGSPDTVRTAASLRTDTRAAGQADASSEIRSKLVDFRTAARRDLMPDRRGGSLQVAQAAGDVVTARADAPTLDAGG